MFIEILFLIFGLCILAGRNTKYKKRIEEYNKTGWYIKSNKDLEESLIQNYCLKYRYTNKDDVPEKYRTFFMFNEKAMYDYFFALAARDVWKQGYRPFLFSIMPKEGFDFLEGFHKKYDPQVDEFNRNFNKIEDKKQ